MKFEQKKTYILFKLHDFFLIQSSHKFPRFSGKYAEISFRIRIFIRKMSCSTILMQKINNLNYFMDEKKKFKKKSVSFILIKKKL